MKLVIEVDASELGIHVKGEIKELEVLTCTCLIDPHKTFETQEAVDAVSRQLLRLADNYAFNNAPDRG